MLPVDRREIMKGIMATAVSMAAASIMPTFVPSEEAMSRWVSAWCDENLKLVDGLRYHITFEFNSEKFLADARSALTKGEMV